MKNRHLYHSDWENISYQIRSQAGWKCEGTPDYPDCEARHLEIHPDTGSKVILTTAHMDQSTDNNDPANLRALCQRCHLNWDRPTNNRNRRYGKAHRREEQLRLKLNHSESP